MENLTGGGQYESKASQVKVERTKWKKELADEAAAEVAFGTDLCIQICAATV